MPTDEVVGRTVHSQAEDRLEAVLVLPSRGKINVLNELGTRIWTLADGEHTVKEIVAAICMTYEIDQSTAEQDTLQFLELLLERGVIRIAENPIR